MIDRKNRGTETILNRVKISSKFQIVIPREVREALHLQKGQIVSVIPVGGVIEVVPDRDHL